MNFQLVMEIVGTVVMNTLELAVIGAKKNAHIIMPVLVQARYGCIIFIFLYSYCILPAY